MSSASRPLLWLGSGCAALLGLLNPLTSAQTLGEPEDFTAVAIVNNNLASGAGTVLIHISRWSTESERSRLIQTLQDKGSDQLLDELKDMQSVGTIRTPDSLAYDLRYAHQRKVKMGGVRSCWRRSVDRVLGSRPSTTNDSVPVHCDSDADRPGR